MKKHNQNTNSINVDDSTTVSETNNDTTGGKGQVETTGEAIMSILGTTLLPSLENIPQLGTEQVSIVKETRFAEDNTSTSHEETEPLEWAEHWNLIADALEYCTNMARKTAKGFCSDFTSEIKDAEDARLALETVREGLPLLVQEFKYELEQSLRWHREKIDGLTVLKLAMSQNEGQED